MNLQRLFLAASFLASLVRCGVSVQQTPSVMVHPGVDPTSDEELQLMGDVEFLQLQLGDAGRPVHADFANFSMQT